MSDFYSDDVRKRRRRKLVGSGLLGASAFKFSPALATFTPSMAKRNSAGPFAAGVMVQGKRDGSGVGDNLSFTRGIQINGSFYSNFDSYQGSMVFWITPEWNGNDGLSHFVFVPNSSVFLFKTAANVLRLYVAGGIDISFDVSSWVAGNTYCVCLSWDNKNTIDGTNHTRISVNDVHGFDGTVPNSAAMEAANTLYMGSLYDNTSPANAIIEGLTIYRRVLWDGAYGQDVGNGDEINLIYNSGTGRDPCEITGSWDVTLCVPTDAVVGALG